MKFNKTRTAFFIGSLLLSSNFGYAADITTLYDKNYQEYAPAGKNTNAIFGDYVLRNDRLTAVVADPDLWVGRSGSRKGGEQFYGRLIDLTTRDNPNDLLDIYDPIRFGPRLRYINQARGRDGKSKQDEFPDEGLAWRLPGRQLVTKPRVELTIPFLKPGKKVVYSLEDGKPYLSITAFYSDPKAGAPELVGPYLSMGQFPGSDPKSLLSGIDQSGHFYWVYDPWFGQAYGVYSPDYQLSILARSSDLGNSCLITTPTNPEKPSGHPSPAIVTQWLIPGHDLFEVRARLNESLGVKMSPVHFKVTDAISAIANADVVLQVDGQIYAAGRTDASGQLSTQLPAQAFELIVTAPGRAAQKSTFDAGKQSQVDIACSPAALLTLTVTDSNGQPIPYKAELLGKGQTPDPYFGPNTAEYGVHNLLYSAGGNTQRPLPPGEYELLISHGPEYEASISTIKMTAGQTTAIKAQLAHVVNTQGWISANFENRTSISRFQSNSSNLGRVLNLLAENIEFAPATDIDHINDLSPAIKALNATSLLATCPGVRMSWGGRKYAHRYYDSFPLSYIQGKEDGGMLQRPQHVMLRTWLARWNPSDEKIITSDEPNVRREFMKDINGDGKPDIGYGSEVIDIHTPVPLAEDEQSTGTERRIFDWLDAVGLGYDTPAIVSSDEPDNWHANAAFRTYLRIDDSSLMKLDAREIIKPIKQGASVVTTGVFLTAQVTTDATPQNKPGLIGDTVISRDGKVQLHIETQAPSWMSIDKVAILVNGQPNPKWTYTRQANPSWFNSSPKPFDQTIPLQLDQDTFIVVVVSGSSVRLGRYAKDQAQTRQPQVAVTNPIRVDLHGDGFVPSPMQPMQSLDIGGPTNEGVIKTLRPISADPAAPAGRLQMPMVNRTDTLAKGDLSFEVNPEGSLQFLPIDEHPFTASVSRYQGGSKLYEFTGLPMSNNHLTYSLEPKKTVYVELEAKLAKDRTPGGFWIFAPRQETPVQRTPVGQYIEVAGYTIPLLPKLTSLAQTDALLPEKTPYILRTSDQTQIGTVKLAANRTGLIADIRLPKTNATKSNRVSIYLTNSPKLELREYDPFYRPSPPLQLFDYNLTWTGDGSDAKLTQSNRLTNDVTFKLTQDEQGYRVKMMIPFRTIRIPGPKAGQSFLMEVQAEQVDGKGTPTISTVFGSPHPDSDNIMYGRIEPK